MMATLQREAITQLENKPETQGFILSYYTSGEIETVKITRPQCEFKFYSPNRPSLVTETEECKKIPLNFSDSGKPLDKDNFLFYLGLDIRTADECCKSNCKDILKAKLPLITAQKQKMESTQSQMIEGLKGAVAE